MKRRTRLLSALQNPDMMTSTELQPLRRTRSDRVCASYLHKHGQVGTDSRLLPICPQIMPACAAGAHLRPSSHRRMSPARVIREASPQHLLESRAAEYDPSTQSAQLLTRRFPVDGLCSNPPGRVSCGPTKRMARDHIEWVELSVGRVEAQPTMCSCRGGAADMRQRAEIRHGIEAERACVSCAARNRICTRQTAPRASGTEEEGRLGHVRASAVQRFRPRQGPRQNAPRAGRPQGEGCRSERCCSGHSNDSTECGSAEACVSAEANRVLIRSATLPGTQQSAESLRAAIRMSVQRDSYRHQSAPPASATSPHVHGHVHQPAPRPT